MALRSHTFLTRHGGVRLSDSGGNGFPVLFIHGSGSSRQVFARQMESGLADKWRMIAIDLPGHGKSANASEPSRAYTTVGFADCVEDAVRQLALPRLAVFGWSLGGHVAIELMSRSARVAGLVLTGTPPVSPGLIGMLRGFLPSFDLLLASKEVYSERDAERFERLCFGASADPSFNAMIMRTDGRCRAIFSRSMMRGDGVDQRRAIESATIPVALVNGSDDPFVRQSYLENLEIPHLFAGRPLSVAGAGHAPFWEKPETFNPLLDSFLDSVASREAEHRQGERQPAAS